MMRMLKKLWSKLMGKKETEIFFDTPEKTPYDYGLSMLRLALRSDDYGWEEKPFKKVSIMNVKACENKISLMEIASAWRGTGHAEWEYWLAGTFIMQVTLALENDEETADISMLFNRDLLASRNRRFSQEQVYKHLIGWFDIIEESENELKLALRVED